LQDYTWALDETPQMSVHKMWSLRWPLVQATFPLPLIAGLAVLYFIACKLGLQLAVIHPSATAIWPGTGIALAAVLLQGYRVWPGIFLGAFAVNLTTAGSILSSLGIATGNTLEAVVGAYLVARFANGRKVFDRAEDIFKFMFLACVLATNVSASIGVASLVLTGNSRGMQPEALWLTWWLGDMAGAILVTPCFLLWSSQQEARPSRQLVAMQGAAVISLLLVGAMVFGGSFPGNAEGYALRFICTPFVVWVAFELRPRAAALAMLAFSAVAVGSALHGARGTPISNESLLLTQVFLGVAGLTGLLVSVAVTERDCHEQTLEKAKVELEERVMERTRELEKRIAKQERAEKTLRGLSRRLLQAQDEERRRIARELHDSTGQSLAVLVMELSNLSKKAMSLSPELSRKLDENAETVRGISNELRTTSYLLHPPLLDEMGLRSGLRWYIAGFKERSNIEVRLNMAENLRFPADLEMMIFRVVQECLTNIHRHSGSAKAEISLSKFGQKLTLEIRDEGEGIPPDKVAGAAGVGLRGMRERVKGFGGELEIHSNGTGTLVRAVIPLGAPAGVAEG
jgi:two-component system, NarL family, sensor histidine kinase FusK